MNEIETGSQDQRSRKAKAFGNLIEERDCEIIGKQYV